VSVVYERLRRESKGDIDLNLGNGEPPPLVHFESYLRLFDFEPSEDPPCSNDHLVR
jgi:hypothetical protein